jgi:hypothetical protein
MASEAHEPEEEAPGWVRTRRKRGPGRGEKAPQGSAPDFRQEAFCEMPGLRKGRGGCPCLGTFRISYLPQLKIGGSRRHTARERARD